MECTVKNEIIIAYLDGELADEEKARYEEHLRTCNICQKNIDDFNKTFRLLHTIEPIEAEPGYLSAILSRVEKVKRPVFIRLVKPLVAAAVILIFIVGTLMFTVYRGSAPAPVDDNTNGTRILSENIDLFQSIEVVDNAELYEQIESIDVLSI